MNYKFTLFFPKNIQEIMTVGQVNHLHLSHLLTFTGQTAFLIPGNLGNLKSSGKQFCQRENLMDLCLILTTHFVHQTILHLCTRFLYSGQVRGGLIEVLHPLFPLLSCRGKEIAGDRRTGAPTKKNQPCCHMFYLVLKKLYLKIQVRSFQQYVLIF